MPGRIDPLEVAIEARDGQHVERQIEESAQFLLGAPTIDEHANLIADGGQHREQFGVRLADLAAEKLHHAEHFAPQQDGEAERRVETLACAHSGAREIRVAHDVRDPGRLA